MFALLFELLRTLVKFIYHGIITVIHFIIPVRLAGKNVKGERVLITGAGSGIGRGLALKFAEKKSTLCLWDIDKAENEETAIMCRKYGAKVVTYVCDVSNRQQVYTTATKIKNGIGDIDILINNAGVVSAKTLLDCSDDQITKTMDINTMSLFWATRAFLPSMLERKHGHIVTIASYAAFQGVSHLIDYCTSKAAAFGFMEALHYELIDMGRTGIYTTVVCPGKIKTGLFKGARPSRCPFLLPDLEVKEAVDAIFSAILTNKCVLIVPKILYPWYALKRLLPTVMQELCVDLMGVNNIMHTFIAARNKLRWNKIAETCGLHTS